MVSSIASAVAERVSPRNIASSPNRPPTRNSASATSAPVLVLAREQHGAAADQVAGVAGVALAEEDLAALPPTRHGHLRHLVELALLETGEDLGAREQAGCLLAVAMRA